MKENENEENTNVQRHGKVKKNIGWIWRTFQKPGHDPLLLAVNIIPSIIL